MKLGRNFVIYLGSSIAAGALPLALMPFLTHNLAPSEYGVMVTITTVVALIGPVLNWATTSYVGVQYFKVSPDAFPEMFSSVLLLPAINFTLLTAFSLLANVLLSHWLDIPSRWVIAIPLMALLLFLPQMAQTILAMRDRALGFAAIELSGAFINFVGTIVLVLMLGMSWEGRIIAAAVSSSVLSVVAVTWFRRRGFIVWRFKAEELRGAFHFGGGGVAHDLASNALRLGDRLLIVTLIGQAAVGTYAVAVQWTTIMLTVLTAFNRAWVPFLFSRLSSEAPGSQEKVVRSTYLVWAGLFGFFILFNFVTPIGYHLLVDSRYHSSINAVFWLSLGFLFNGIYMTVVDYLFYLKKTHILAIITVFNLVMNMAIAYVLIGIRGPNGAAMAFAITAFIVMCLTFAISYRLHPMPWLRSVIRRPERTEPGMDENPIPYHAPITSEKYHDR